METRRFMFLIIPTMMMVWAGTLTISGCAVSHHSGSMGASNNYQNMNPSGEINRFLHMFQEWMRGSVPNDEANLASFLDAFHEDFERIDTEGVSSDRESIKPFILNLYGADAEVVFSAENIREVAHRDDLFVYRYDEHITMFGAVLVLKSTAVFVADEDAPHGVVWLHVHETAEAKKE